jgi:Helix-turn-helix domain
MSWGALAWATDSDVGSSAAKFILILLANKADENYSCYPSIRTLMAESNASRSTVLRALKNLETRGFISRRPQFHDSAARRSTRYYLNHPLAPQLSPSPDLEPPRPDLEPPGPDPRRAPSRCDTGRVSKRHPTGVSQWDPLNPSTESIRTGWYHRWNLGGGDRGVEAEHLRGPQSPLRHRVSRGARMASGRTHRAPGPEHLRDT